MGFLRAHGPTLPMSLQRFVTERRGASIGTLPFRRQCKRVSPLGFWLALGISCSTPVAAHAAETGLTPTTSALPPPPPPAAASALPVPVAPSAAPPGAPGNDLPAPPRAPRGATLHDGFYLRMALGLGGGGARVSSDSKSIGDYDIGGAAGALDLWIGGTPTSGLVMGAALSALGLSSSRRSVDGQQVSGDVVVSTGILAYFVDIFPNPQRGLHLGGALGVASGAAEVKDNGRKFQGAGLGLQAWGGYEFWVSPQWSLGGMLRFAGSVTGDEQESVGSQASLGAATLSFTALYH